MFLFDGSIYVIHYFASKIEQTRMRISLNVFIFAAYKTKQINLSMLKILIFSQTHDPNKCQQYVENYATVEYKA